jgi:hypothetical protein
MTGPRILVVLAGLAACTPQPRSQSYFEGHRAEAARVLADCARGDRRGADCVNAQAAEVSARREARMKRYRQGF